MMDFNLEAFLLERERRVEVQKEMLKKYGVPLLMIKANYPGKNKNSYIPNRIVEIFREKIETIFKKEIVDFKRLDNIEGVIYLYAIDYKDKEIKKIAIEIEEKHQLGRVVDIDVYRVDGSSFSRTEFQYPKRRCILCEKNAFLCRREGNHGLEELLKEIEKKVENYDRFEKEREKKSEKFSNLALKSIILEVSCSPSFGLVSPKTKGAHSDMDFFMFLESGFSISSYLKLVAKSGYSPLSLDIIFKKIRNQGIEAEREMFCATGGVNTHKGMIFLMGIVLACSMKSLYENLQFKEIQNLIKNMCRGILDDFQNLSSKKSLTNGERLFIKYGYTGVRGVVKGGLDIVFNGALEIFEKNLNMYMDINKAMVITLVYIISVLDDTTILHRHNREILLNIQRQAKDIYDNITINGFDTKLLEDIEKEYSEKRISPGGGADLLAVTLFLSLVKKSSCNNME